MQAIYLDIAIPVPLRRSFQYKLPDTVSVQDLVPGMRVKVSFGRQHLIGILLSFSNTSKVDPKKIKFVTQILDSESLFHPTILSICRWAASYYQHPIGEVLQSALPVLLRQGESSQQSIDRLIASNASIDAQFDSGVLKRSPKQYALLKQLQTSSHGLTRHDLRQSDISSTIIKALIDKDLAQWTQINSLITPFKAGQHNREAALPLTEEQSIVLNTVTQTGTHLIFGITGSGKTEIYLQAIEQTLIQGKQALVLVPEIGLTPQTLQRFQSRFKVQLCVLHSGLSDKERLDAWRQARGGAAAIIIGTRSAIFTPMLKPGLIVIDEEHDASFKQQEGFRYSARDIAVLRGQIESMPVLLGSATPSFESYNNATSGKYSLSRLKSRPKATQDTQYKLIGTQHENLENGFSRPLVKLIEQHLGAGNQVLIFLNRRGFSPVILCQGCGWIAECKRCDARMTYHMTQASLICHHCGAQRPVMRHCASCQSEHLVPLGFGTQRIEQAMHSLFKGQDIIRIDRDSTRRKGSMAAIMKEVMLGKPSILVGTQLLAKGHHFPDVTLVAIVDMDAGFYSADYRAIERMGQLLLQVGGRAGREAKPGTVAIQTQFPDQPILGTLISDGYEVFTQQLLEERLKYHLPPFAHQAIIRAEAKQPNLAMQFLSTLNRGKSTHSELNILGPIASSMEKRAGKHRAQLLLSSSNRRTLQGGLAQCVNIAETSELGRKVRWSVDVDPVDLF